MHLHFAVNILSWSLFYKCFIWLIISVIFYFLTITRQLNNLKHLQDLPTNLNTSNCHQSFKYFKTKCCSTTLFVDLKLAENNKDIFNTTFLLNTLVNIEIQSNVVMITSPPNAAKLEAVQPNVTCVQEVIFTANLKRMFVI